MVRPSWQFAEDLPISLLVALLVRDELRLESPHGALVPPPLHADGVGSAVSTTSAQASAKLPAEWASWWHALMGAWSSRDPISYPRKPESHRVYDPPGFPSLSGSPALRKHLADAYPDLQYRAERIRIKILSSIDTAPPIIDWDLTRTAVEAVASKYEVQVSDLTGTALLIPVEGLWWRLVAPGTVVCSVYAARAETTARAAVTDAFASSLGRPPTP